ncbi:TIGR03087 family PEP-CTERM/XrtA system glycosyltransferase [Undibacterium sp.]|jgi:sugar transferase (PEP-CTERM/EpsH1 system associated)|uniref:TIGR03087 family PEP-CTERM/XrtA system glycosyltransferase n=1 Tax=Undibacterium sp. TaxID=1914977 RepID=UPI002CE4BBEA|nr:TIGR03087 family PEP-CTERM/XrtA system glycosyltransferase [Undibacterium sp.]HTD05570.1 TIGR03087 family PEP-CTERM/XrtA system glycosyltransferase [Undibacterium sp.]
MDDLLLLVHRIPFPPNKGDKIRSYHLLKHLAQNYRVHLGSFIDDENDWQYVDNVKKLCHETHIARLDPRSAKLRSLAALLGNRPLSLDYYRNAGLQAWVDAVIRQHQIKRIVVFSSAMAQFVEHVDDARRIIDFVDVDSDKWLQYADQKVWPLSWLYRREGNQLLAYERRLAQECDAALFVSQAEAGLFRRLAPESAARIDFFNNGVDTEYFSPELTHENPYPNNEKAIAFTGAMDYWPNVDAVQWFADEVMPKVLQQHPDAVFYIVGARPSEQVRELAKLPGVRVTGSVPDVRPYLAHARVAVASLRIARGIQNKVLEAMAMAKSVVVSPQALEGIDAEPGRELMLATDAPQFAAQVVQLLTQENTAMEHSARAKVIARYNWTANLSRVDALLDPAAPPHGAVGSSYPSDFSPAKA